MENDSKEFSVIWYDGRLKLDTWDDGFGPLWIMRNSISIDGIVRADTWENAYSACVDEILADADEADALDDRGNLIEGYEYRGGVPSNPKLESNVASIDLNGQLLEKLTLELCAKLNLKIEWKDYK
jgi:hypothetical protein